MKIRVWPKVPHYTLLYHKNPIHYPLKPHYTLLYNQLSSNPIGVFWDTFLTNKTSFFNKYTTPTHFIVIKT